MRRDGEEDEEGGGRHIPISDDLVGDGASQLEEAGGGMSKLAF